ncbi:MAG: Na/Pi cotransporter family protein [Defluviitaleaceae bacterium]|nr:Na/Pi cotransporter family protein [Defluviitaleaceae bacterium]MCL2837278.1 Na/Pi cotransporter family protein [Defluviitaleaceae bacterium]
MGAILENIFLAIGGLGLLLFGMKMMSSGLEIVAGNRLQAILKRATSNRFLAVFVGIIATICINSSTAVTIITVGFVNSRLINLTQSIGIIMGANVGTTFSAQLIAFRIDTVAPLFIFIGIIMYLFFKNKNIKNIGYVILGFGILLFSINVMGAPLKEFAQHPSFNTILTAVANPFLALLAGFLFTAVIQSSSATMGLLVTMHLNGVPIPFETSAFIILGTNIGTSITTVLASIPASRESKRAALFHITYDIIGSTVFGMLIFVFPAILGWFQATWAESARQVAMFHTLYNVATLTLLLPFVKWIALLMQKVVPLKQDEINNVYEKKLVYLDTKIMPTPALAVINAHREICRMGKIAVENLALALEAFFEKNEDKVKKAFDNEAIIDYLNHNIASKLVEINNMALSYSDAKKLSEMFKVSSDIERIGDHSENIAEYTLVAKDNNLIFSDAAAEELKVLGNLTIVNITNALNLYERQNESQSAQSKSLKEIVRIEDEVDNLSVKFVDNHIERLKAGNCDPKSGVIFTEMIIDLERSSDHAKNIAFSVLPKKPGEKK